MGCFGSVGCLEDKQPDDSADEKQQNWIRFPHFRKVECTQEQCYAGSESKRIFCWRSEILLIHQEHSCCCNQSDDGRAKACEDILHDLGILMGYQIAADENHDDEWQPHDGKGCQEGARPGCPGRITGMKTSGITHISGAVDADRTRSRLADSHDIRKLGVGEPMVLYYCFVVDE